ncbi:LysE family translocator [Nesterenkonia sp. MY13]|uniref:LysE family translocator n=1 Tax=Nesterenkonia sedimenti TaxID=1463632 RepID=A0A7X8TH66_9MICC|nr:LysE family translocator [Nesterenkonia sedimenti]NLS08461.1 LysE family translocator [Nesterenkonia sedimenti]
MTLATYFGLLAVAAVLAVTPGPDTMLSLRYALRSRRAGLGAATGSSAAAFIWAALAAVGLAALFEASPLAYELLSVVGGLYLLFLGTRAVLSARTRIATMATVATEPVSGAAGSQPPSSPVATLTVPKARVGFLAGMATCMTNPKVGLFFLALFPQFTPTDASLIFTIGVLGGTVAATMYLYLIAVVLLVDAANRWLSSPKATSWIEGISGATLIGLGIFMLGSGGLGLLTLWGG